MSNHAWCHDIARDAAVRAAEDERQGALPTLEEAIVLAFGFDKASAQRACDEVNSWPEDVQKDCRCVLGNLLEQGVERLQALVEAWRYGKGLLAARYPAMLPKSGSATSAPEQENKGDGMRTERVTLEITRPAIANYPAPARQFMWQHLLRDVVQGDRESVRVVEEACPDAWAQTFARLEAERDAAIRERDRWCAQSGIHEEAANHATARTNAAVIRVGEVMLERDAAIRERDAAVTESERRLRLCETMKRDGDSARFHAAVAQARVAELEAASGGGEREVANVTFHADDSAERARYVGMTVKPLRRPQPRGWLTGEEREAVQWAADAAYDKQHPAEDTLRNLLARSTPPEIRLPNPFFETKSHGPLLRKRDVIAALAAAGVEVKEVGR